MGGRTPPTANPPGKARRVLETCGTGLSNPEAFERIALELPGRRVVAPRLTQRQIRRVIYG